MIVPARRPLALALLLLVSLHAGTYSGIVTDLHGVPVPGVHVKSLTDSATTKADGSWNIDKSTGIAVGHISEAKVGSHLVVNDGHPRLSWKGFGLDGRSQPIGIARLRTARSEAMRSLDAGDTLKWFWKDKRLVVLPVAAEDSSAIEFQIDTAWSDDHGIPWNPRIPYSSATTSDGRCYRTVGIGPQTWMAENLRFRSSGADSGRCLVDRPDTCAKYGRMYTWAQAMDLSGAYNTTSLNASVPRRGNCPVGWHVPRFVEWTTMVTTIEADSRVGAGKGGLSLKSRNGWRRGAGADHFGFRVLPTGDIDSAGDFAEFWTSTEYAPETGRSEDADFRYIGYGLGGVGGDYGRKTDGNSVRCIRDFDSTLSSLSVTGGGPLSPKFDPAITVYADTLDSAVGSAKVTGVIADPQGTVKYDGSSADGTVNLARGQAVTVSVIATNAIGKSSTYSVRFYRKAVFDASSTDATGGVIPWNHSVAYDSLRYEGQTYKTVEIGGRTWMAENLNYAGPDGKLGACYDDNPNSCSRYGRYYSWAEAMDLDTIHDHSSWVPDGAIHKGVCPAGWHIPSDSEWTDLMKSVDGADSAGATRLKSSTGWSQAGNGTDQYGFRALPAGYDFARKGNGSGVYANWWSSTEIGDSYANSRSMSYSNAGVGHEWGWKINGFSVRCVRNP